MNRLPLLLTLVVFLGPTADGAEGYEARPEFENRLRYAPGSPGLPNPDVLSVFGGHSGRYPMADTHSGIERAPASPDGRYRLLQSSFGQPFEGRKPDFQLGAVIVPPLTVDTGVAPVIDPTNSAFYVPSRNLVIAADRGLVRIDWSTTNGATLSRVYLISGVPERRPARIFWTEEPYNAPTVSLRDRFTRIHYNTMIAPPVPDLTITNQPLKQYLQGLWEDEQHILHAKGVTGMAILEFFETGERARQVGWEVVEVAVPRVNVQSVAIGERLLPVDSYYGTDDLRTEVRKGLPTLAYQHATRTPGGPKDRWLFPIARTVDAPYQLEVYWKHTGVMDVEWPFELDWYAADWPSDDLAQRYVRDSATTNASVVIPRELQVTLENYQDPPRHAALANNGAGDWVFSTSQPGHALLRYSANEDVWFQVVRSVDHRDAALFDLDPLSWSIGEELHPAQVRTALTLATNAQVDLPLGQVSAATFEGWVRSDLPQSLDLLVSHAAGDPSRPLLRLGFDAAQRVLLAAWTNGAWQPIQIGRTFVRAGEWTHLAFSLGVDTPSRLFVNGVEDATPASLPAVPGGTLSLLGPAQLAEVRAWTRLLGPDEIQVRRADRLVGAPPGLAFCLQFEPLSQSAIINAVDGTVLASRGAATRSVVSLTDLEPEWSVYPGYVHAPEGIAYHPGLYRYPAPSSHLFPVNTGTLEVWWSREARQEGMPVGVAWPSLVNRYTCGWSPDAPSLVIAGQNTGETGILGSSMTDPSLYYQNDPLQPGYNPNEEHALLFPGRVYAIRDDLNTPGSSLPYVLVQYTDTPTGAPRMIAFQVTETNEVYQFGQQVVAGTLLQPPMPLAKLPRCAESLPVRGPSWRDRNLDYWAAAAAADGTNTTDIVVRHYYPVQPGFAFPGERNPPAPGSPVPWLSRQGSGGVPADYTYTVRWPDDVPVLQRGETLFTARDGLPSVRGQKSVSLIYQQSTALAADTPSVVLIDPTRERSVPLDALPGDLRTETQRGKKFFPSLPPHLRNRLYFDPDRKLLLLLGQFVQPTAGQPYLLLNILDPTDRATVAQLSADPDWTTKVGQLAAGPVILPDENTPFDSLALSAGLARGTGFVTVAFNNSTTLNEPPDPISLAILRVDASLFRGEIKVVKSDNPLDEQLTLQHSGDFAGDPTRFEFDWILSSPSESGTPPPDLATWQAYTGAATRGPRVVLGGPGLLTLTDHFFRCRYRPSGSDDTGWSEWTDPMLAEGWIKRVVNGINPFEQRLAHLEDNAVNTTVSMISQAGARWEGDVPLNLDNLDDFGLIAIYETVLRRGRALSIDASIRDRDADDALLLVAGRLHDLYMILGNEAYADAADPTVGFGTADRAAYGSEWTSLFCFMNQVPNLLEEELALLRGRDDSLLPSVDTPPFYNRLIWNFTKGMNGGESAYALNYGVRNQDGDVDGVIDEADAKRLYPQGHGDAWGHYLTAIKGYYHLLASTNFDWIPRIESMLVGGVPVSVDYYDERKFAEAAAARARTGAQIVELTHRQLYRENPANVPPALRDTRPERAWGVAEWGSRVGQAALFDWAVANSLLPDQDTNADHVGIQIIDRTTVPELDEIVGNLSEVQSEMDRADRGMNPLGLDPNAMAFDISPAEADAGRTHFEQIYDRALGLVDNAARILARAQEKSQLLRRQADSLEDLGEAVASGEDDYRNRLIEIFGYPYPDDIGPGKTYPQGYVGPDLYHFQYVEVMSLTGTNSPLAGTNLVVEVPTYDLASATVGDAGGGWSPSAQDLLQLVTNAATRVSFHVADNGLLIKPPEWTAARPAQGEVQLAYSDFLLAWYDLQRSVGEYNALLGDIVDGYTRLQARVTQFSTEEEVRSSYGHVIAGAEVASKIANAAADYLSDERDLLLAAMAVPKEAIPQSFIAGLAAGGDMLSTARAAIKAAEASTITGFKVLKFIAKGAFVAAEITKAVEQSKLDSALRGQDHNAGLLEARLNLERIARQQEAKRLEVQGKVERLAQAQARYRSALLKGERLLDERTTTRARAATAIQADRYADMTFRLFRDEALGRYRSAFDLAARYVYLTAKAYSYETGLTLGAADGRSALLEAIVNTRSLGHLDDGKPVTGATTGDPGLADVLARLHANWEVVRGRLGFNNPARESSRLSLRAELFRIGSPDDPVSRAASDATWRQTLWSYKVDNLLDLPEFRRYCLPFAPLGSREPALVIPFATTIESKRNVFGWDLAGGDHTYDSTHFATKIRAVGVWFANFNAAFDGGLGFAPRVYLIPAGDDRLREPGDPLGTPRTWHVVDQALPVPYDLDTGALDAPDWLPFSDGLTEGFATLRKYASLRAYHDAGTFDPAEMTSNARLIGRSIWNTRWLLIIPASTLHSDTDHALEWFIDGIHGDGNGVADIKLLFQTYSYSGN